MGTDERDGGLLAADMFVRYWNKEKPGIAPHILLLDVPQIPEPQRKMIAFEEVVSEKLPGRDLLPRRLQRLHRAGHGGDRAVPAEPHPEINFIYGINASSTLGGIAACERAGSLDITHASSGAEPPILALMKKPLNAKGGGAVWDVGYGKSAVQYGNHLVEVACKAITAKSVAGLKIDIGFQEVWRTNVDDVIKTMQEWRKKANLSPVEF